MDVVIGKVDNMHRIWEFPVGELLENGKNTLRVIIRSPLKFMAEAFKKYKNRGNEDTIEDLCICAKLTICVAGTGVHVCRMEVSSVL